MKTLQDTADLFEVSFPEYKQLRQCRSDIILVKAVWDMVIFVKVRMTNHKGFRWYFLLHIHSSSRLSFWAFRFRKSNLSVLCCFCDSQV